MVLLAGDAAAQEARWVGAVRAGAEYDNNPYRAEGWLGEGDGLTRYYGELEVEAAAGDSGQVQGQLQHGGKVFLRERDADAFLTAAQLSGTRWWTSGVMVSVAGDVKDRTERISARDYVRGGARGQVMWARAPVRVWGAGGWRYFGFKPSADVSSQGPMAQVGAALRVREDVWLSASLSRSWRGFEVEPLQLEEEQALAWVEGEHRADVF